MTDELGEVLRWTGESEGDFQKRIVKAKATFTENNQFAALCRCMRMRILEVKGDGHCLFRALAMGVPQIGRNYQSLRELCSSEMLRERDTYLPFMASEPIPQHAAGEDTEDFDSYCAGVLKQKWGGNMELRALSNALNVIIELYDSTGSVDEGTFVPDSVFSSDDTPSLVRLTYHKASGAEHYQLMVPIQE